MESFVVDSGAAIWLGILTSISPCPLATNIAAISYVGRKVEKTRLVLLAGLLYTLGRTLAYLVVALAVSRSMQVVPGLSLFLQTHMNRIIGPLLIVVGFLLLGVIHFNVGGRGMGEKLQARVDRMGIWGAGVMGVLFALAFCPVSAGLFFGALLPLAIRGNAVLMSSLYGIGTAVPVLVFAFLLTFAAHAIGQAFHRLTVVERWVRRVTAVVLILVGVYLVVKHVLGVSV